MGSSDSKRAIDAVESALECVRESQSVMQAIISEGAKENPDTQQMIRLARTGSVHAEAVIENQEFELETLTDLLDTDGK